MKKRDLRALRKKRKGPGEEDSDDDSAIDSSFMAIPRQVNAANQGKAETSRLQRKRQKILVGAPKSVTHVPAAPTPLVALPPPDLTQFKPFSKAHWSGNPGEDPPSEELKTQRKEIGVLVKGNLLLCPPPIITLHDAFLPPAFSKIFHSLGLSIPSPIQMQCWPAALAGANILALAPTGSGKTLAYGLPIIPHIEHQIKSRRDELKAEGETLSLKNKIACPFALILVPTRELAIQVASALKCLKKHCFIRAMAIYGGQDKDLQIGELHNGGELHIIVATPGRLLDLMAVKKISLSKVTYLVIDEADRMLTMGFVDQLNAISRQIRSDRQTLLFTATFPGKLREVADNWSTDAVVIRCSTMELQRKTDNKDNKDTDKAVLKKESKINEAEDAEKTNKNEKKDKKIIQNESTESGKNVENGDKTTLHESSDETEGTAEISEMAGTTEKKSHSDINTLSLTISPTVTQAVHVCATHKKPRLLIRFITTVREQEKLHKMRQPGAMIIFATKIKSVKFVVDFLHRQNISSEPLHGQLPQSQRERALNEFKAVRTLQNITITFYFFFLFFCTLLCSCCNVTFTSLFSFHFFFFHVK